MLSPRGPHAPVGTKCTEGVTIVIDSLEARSSPALPVVAGRGSLAKCFVSHFFGSLGNLLSEVSQMDNLSFLRAPHEAVRGPMPPSPTPGTGSR